MGKKIRTEEVDHLFEAILCLKNKEIQGKGTGNGIIQRSVPFLLL